jgi:hypothetical protein
MRIATQGDFSILTAITPRKDGFWNEAHDF